MQIEGKIIQEFQICISSLRESYLLEQIKDNISEGIQLFYLVYHKSPQMKCKSITLLNTFSNLLWQKSSGIIIDGVDIELNIFDNIQLLECQRWCFATLKLILLNPNKKVFSFYIIFISLFQFQLLNDYDQEDLQSYFSNFFLEKTTGAIPSNRTDSSVEDF
ncbi:hypothetical protein EDI_277880 [Entamoeba dispar SAW760]|uniref:Uncharacterized protein n=1 Tax=Entamoeba dispar (strain ATCC PRA-260 / SAW760) TaxID=370354 RepID=B0ECS5_ENTDS|nr:uncharacterized protein EDI_277880 [Entamoeba dispar SAW760]EDR27617.1 hypothetical protein EDI_277880 [Entamoeba dispar SAW760]|eukprot:EDR27617.1 hypothetical protein EDI_277880 [Entamoeba dispar SAW760]